MYADMSAMKAKPGLQPHEAIMYALMRRVEEAKSPKYSADKDHILAAIRQLVEVIGASELPEQGLSRHFVLNKLRQISEIAGAEPAGAQIQKMLQEVLDDLHSKGWKSSCLR